MGFICSLTILIVTKWFDKPNQSRKKERLIINKLNAEK
jgi:hypothetical protein